MLNMFIYFLKYIISFIIKKWKGKLMKIVILDYCLDIDISK